MNTSAGKESNRRGKTWKTAEIFTLNTRIISKEMNNKYLKYNKPAKEAGLFDRGDRGAQSARYRRKYGYKNKAHQATYRALKMGLLKVSPFCQVCGAETKTMAHHSDYEKQLSVLWVCQFCHNDIHKILKDRR